MWVSIVEPERSLVQIRPGGFFKHWTIDCSSVVLAPNVVEKAIFRQLGALFSFLKVDGSCMVLSGIWAFRLVLSMVVCEIHKCFPASPDLNH